MLMINDREIPAGAIDHELISYSLTGPHSDDFAYLIHD